MVFLNKNYLYAKKNACWVSQGVSVITNHTPRRTSSPPKLLQTRITSRSYLANQPALSSSMAWRSAFILGRLLRRSISESGRISFFERT